MIDAVRNAATEFNGILRCARLRREIGIEWRNYNTSVTHRLRVSFPVQEVNEKTNREPDDETLPRLNRKRRHLCETENRAKDRNPWQSRRAKWPLELG